MKKIIFYSILSMGFFLNAQTEKGSKLIGVGFGSLSFTNSEFKNTNSFSTTEYNTDRDRFNISINPSISWFVINNLAIGGSVTVGFENSKSNSSVSSSAVTDESKSNRPSFSIGPMARMYFGKSTSGKPFGQLNLNYGFAGNKTEYTDSTGYSDKSTTKPKGDYSVGATFGYEHFISKYVGIFASLGVNYNKSKTDFVNESGSSSNTNTIVNTIITIPVNFGLQVHLPSKKASKD